MPGLSGVALLLLDFPGLLFLAKATLVIVVTGLAKKTSCRWLMDSSRQRVLPELVGNASLP
jgi:hypothetical protein